MRGRGRLIAPLALAAAATAALAQPALAAKDDVVLISRAGGPAGAPDDGGSLLASISASGDRVAFNSNGNNLSAEDDDAYLNVFVRDAVANTTTVVSRASGAAGAPADFASQDLSISGDGRFVAFESDANNLSAEDNDGVRNIFVRDLVASTTTLVSRASGASGAAAASSSVAPAISADGRYVAFESSADNLSADDDDAVTNVFVRDLVANTTTLVSRAPGLGGAGGDASSFSPSISGDGNRVAFQSGADNLSGEDNDAVVNVFVRELGAGVTTLVSRAPGAAGAAANDASESPSISADGRSVAFESEANNLSPNDNNAVQNLFVRDLVAGQTTLVSRSPGGTGANDDSYNPAISGSGTRVAFISAANNLSTEDDNRADNAFVRDLLAGTTVLVSRGPGATGGAANGNSSVAVISGDGRYVAFRSDASNLVAGTAPGVLNIYRRDVLGTEPISAPACKALPLPSAPAAKGTVTFTLNAAQLLINQRIGQAAIRRLNAVQDRLDGGLSARDLCGYSVGPAQLGPGITSAGAGASLAPVTPADPAPIQDPGRTGKGDPVTLSARQLLINQRVYQAAIRRADGIEARLESGLTGGDIRAGQVTQGKLYDRLQILAAAPALEPPASRTVIPGRKAPVSPGDVTLSVTQLKINQRIAQAGVRDSNALIRRLETGLSGADLRPGTLTAADLG